MWSFILAGAVAFLFLLNTYVGIWAPEFGLTKLIVIGRYFDERGLAVFRATPKYVGSEWGFDGQFYAEMALDPLLRDPQLKLALDNPPYRARRILLPWLAAVLGLGRPFWVLNAYALLNLIFWAGYAVLIGRLFRPYGWPGLMGFCVMLVTCGIIESMQASLTDFPGFVLMTLAVAIGGMGGSVVMALAGLARETSILGLAGIFDFQKPWKRSLRRNLRYGAVAAIPILLWYLYIERHFQIHAPVDGGNIDWPLKGMLEKLAKFRVSAADGSNIWTHYGFTDLYRSESLNALLTMVATLTQCVFLLTYRDWQNRFWRMAIVFVPFFLCIGYPAWESHFTVTRHALPITLAFNLLLAMRPRKAWVIWFILGNCFMPYGAYHFYSLARENPVPPPEFAVASPKIPGGPIGVEYGEGWSAREWNGRDAWRWATGNASLKLLNPTSQSLFLEIGFVSKSVIPRDLMITDGHKNLWTGKLDRVRRTVAIPRFSVPPGETVLRFVTPQEPARPDKSEDIRLLTFELFDPSFRVTAETP